MRHRPDYVTSKFYLVHNLPEMNGYPELEPVGLNDLVENCQMVNCGIIAVGQDGRLWSRPQVDIGQCIIADGKPWTAVDNWTAMDKVVEASNKKENGPTISDVMVNRGKSALGSVLMELADYVVADCNDDDSKEMLDHYEMVTDVIRVIGDKLKRIVQGY